MPLRLVTAPATEPVTLAEAKGHLRYEDSADDSYITALVSAARQHAEELCWRGFITQTWELVLPCFPDCRSIELPKGDVSAVTWLKYFDDAGVERTLDASSYALESQPPARLHLTPDESWPSTQRRWDAVTVRYVAGWANAGAVPVPIKQALLLLIAQMYEFRTDDLAGSLTPQSLATEALLAPYRLRRL